MKGGGLLRRAVTELVESAATSRITARMCPPTAAAGAGAMRFRVIIILAAGGGGEQFALFGRSFIDDYR